MFSPETTATLLIEFYLLGIAGHLILVTAVFNATKPADVSEHAVRTLFWMGLVASIGWPGFDVLLLLMLAPLGGWFRGWLERKYGAAGTSEAVS